MQTGLDHILIGIDDLARGIDWVEHQTGVRAELGGVHPGRGTRNALLALGADCYLEIIAPDPDQSLPAWFPQILSLKEPRLIAWAVHTSNLTALAQRAAEAGFPIDGAHDGARSRPDGKILSWRLFHLRDDRGGLLPFFIEWNRASVHPAQDAPLGCALEEFQLQSPQPDELTHSCRSLDVDVMVKAGKRSLIRAVIAGPKGRVELTS